MLDHAPTDDDPAKPAKKVKLTQHDDPHAKLAVMVREALGLHERLKINLREAVSFDDEKRVATVIIMTDGKGNSDDNHYYFPQTIREAVADKVFDSVQAFADHPTLEEDVIRPERSTRDLIGYYFDSTLTNVTDLNGKNRDAYQAKMQILEGPHYDWVVALIKESIRHRKLFPNKPPLVGISINADGKIGPGTNPEDGTQVNGVSKITRAFSADMVTKPARGGVFLNLKESQRGSRTSLDKDNNMADDKLREAASRVQDQMTRGEIDKDDVQLLIEASLKESAKADPEDKKDGGTDELTEAQKEAAAKALKEAGGKEAPVKEADGSVMESNRAAETVDELKKKFPKVWETALREAQKTVNNVDEVKELRSKVADLEARDMLRESAESARTKLRESGLPTSMATRLMHQLVGKTDEEQTQLIEAEVGFAKDLGLTNNAERVAGAGESNTVALREADKGSRANESALFAGIPGA